jgi:hypothetical protein
VAERWLGGSCLVVVHVAVVPDVQRQGIGHLMHDVLIAGDSAPARVLSCHPAAFAAQRFCRERGWMVLPDKFPAGDEDFWILARDLYPHGRWSLS